MFSVAQKRAIADAVQKILRETNHPELPPGEISFSLHVEGFDPTGSWADIRNNSAVPNPTINCGPRTSRVCRVGAELLLLAAIEVLRP